MSGEAVLPALVSDDLGNQYASSRAVIYDSPPTDIKLRELVEFLLQQSFTVEYKEYPKEQGHNECGYRSIVTCFMHCSPQCFLGCRVESCTDYNSGAVTFLFNKLIGLKDSLSPIPLSNKQIEEIIKRLDLLQSNFRHLAGSIGSISELYTLLNKIEGGLKEASAETKEGAYLYNVTEKTEGKTRPLRQTTEYLQSMLELVLNEAYLNSEILQFDLLEKVNIGNVNYDLLLEKYCSFINPQKLPEWFAGVFRLADFRLHIITEMKLFDRPSGIRSAIIHIPPNHWIVIVYKY